ncbi:MAG: MFS transporter, partial [Chloroflexi bacterium]|nr:MFS transporter [Chloroflexota bacterium]
MLPQLAYKFRPRDVNHICPQGRESVSTFVQKQLHFSVAATSSISIIANIGAIVGGTIFGYHSQHWGRRRAIIIAALLGLLMIPLWTGFLTLPGVPLFLTLALGAFLLQFMVQGAWGVIPVHLNELSP